MPPTAFARRRVSYVGPMAKSRFDAREKATPYTFMRFAPIRSASEAVASIVATALVERAVGRKPGWTSLIRRAATMSGTTEGWSGYVTATGVHARGAGGA